MDLASERCEACQPGAPEVPTEEEPALLAGIPGWNLVEVKGIKRLKRVVRTEGWESAIKLTNQVGTLATEADHHPSILVEWGKVTIQWWTHAIHGLHRNDFIMAARVNDVLDSNQRG